jgi:hypothetical protein
MTTDQHVDIDAIEIPTWQLDLVYVDYRDGFDAEQVEQIIHGEWPDSVDEWISECQWESASRLVDELLDGIDYDVDDWHALMERIIDLDTSSPYDDLMGNSGHMLFRYSPGEDDMAWLSEELDSPAATLEALGLDEQFLPFVTRILPEIAGYKWEGGGSFGASFVFSCSPADLIGKGERVTIHDPFLWLTNPWSGNGYGEVATGCTITLDLADIHVDKYAWGYGADNVFGGLLLPDSTITEAS